MDKQFVVYEHYTPDTKELFYVGEGRPNRAYSSNSRNRFWKFKVKKHGGFVVKIIADSITKIEAETLEKELILKYKESGIQLTNLCDGPMFGNHWLVGKPKELHPMFGKPHPNPKLAKWNTEHSGELSPTFGKKRPDLIHRNKNGNFKRYTTKLRCIELDIIFESMKSAKKYFNGNSNINRAIETGGKAFGYHWERIK